MVDKILGKLLNVLEAKFDTRWTEEHNACWNSLSKRKHRLAQLARSPSSALTEIPPAVPVWTGGVWIEEKQQLSHQKGFPVVQTACQTPTLPQSTQIQG